jgi:HAE1 family hydrophobic/amphiphilic exporter-1
MTSFAFILGCVPLWIASGSGAAGRRIMGTVVIAGMLAATLLAVFLIPLMFVLFERLALRFARGRHESSHGTLAPEGDAS